MNEDLQGVISRLEAETFKEVNQLQLEKDEVEEIKRSLECKLAMLSKENEAMSANLLTTIGVPIPESLPGTGEEHASSCADRELMLRQVIKLSRSASKRMFESL